MALDRQIQFATAIPLLAAAYGRVPNYAAGGILAHANDAWSQKFHDVVAAQPREVADAMRITLHRGLATPLRRMLGDWHCLDVLDHDLRTVIEQIADLYMRIRYSQRDAAEELRVALSKRRIVAPVIKSFDINERFATSTLANINYDIDYLVTWDDYPTVQQILTREMGFVQGQLRCGQIVQASDPRTAETAQGHYEWWPFLKAGPAVDFDPKFQPFLEAIWPCVPGSLTGSHVQALISIDLHYGIDPDISATVAWERVVEYAPKHYGLSASMLLWFISARLYQETLVHGEQKFRALAQVIDILAGADIDWSDLYSLCKEHKTEPSVYYVLSAVNELCGVGPPTRWLSRLGGQFARKGHLRDFGSLWPALLRLDRNETIHISI